jgi:hypothetical protein
MDRPRPPLAPVAALLALLSLGVVLAGCGGDERDAVRERTERYIESEQAVMRRAQPDFERANQAYLAYAKGELEPESAADQVQEAERSIQNARDGVLVLEPPAEARRLHDQLVRYLDMNVELAGETTLLVRYVPAAAGALAPLGRANRRLEAHLADADNSEDQARILEQFEGRVDTIAGELRDLEVPAVLSPVHEEQVRRLVATQRLAGQLRRALRAQDAERVSVLLKRFRSTAPESDVRRRLTNQAVVRYTRRLQRIVAAYADVQQEQMRLARTIG